MTSNAIAMIKPIASPAELLKHQEEVSQLIQGALKDGTDYGLIPGTGDKPVLLKPGAERLCVAFGAHAEYDLIDSEIDHDAQMAWIKRKKIWRNKHPGDREFHWGEENGVALGRYRYRYRCRIVLADGRVIAAAEGVASTLEAKYVDRPRDCENTVCKMAQKRAFVAATLHAFALSNRFTQDLDEQNPDLQAEAQRVQPREQPKPAPQAAPAPKANPTGKGTVYDPDNDTQRAVITEILRKREIPNDWWGAIHGALKGRPSGDLNAVITEVRALMESEQAAARVVDAEYQEAPAQ